MRIGRSIVVSVLVVLAEGVQAPAADVGAVGALPGGENVITQISDATSRHVEVLSDLLDRLPEAARVGLKRALDSARQGRDLALAALNAPRQPGPRGRDGRLDWTDVMRARRTVSFSFHESVSALRKLMREDSEPATAAAAEALPRIKKNRAVALRSFDRILAVRAPGLWRPSSGNPAETAHAPRASRRAQPEEGGHCHGRAPGSGAQGRPAGHP